MTTATPPVSLADYCAAGAIAPDFAAIAYTKRDGRYWPRVEDPFA